MLREFTRWDYELRNGEQVETVVDRALEMALGTPQGPVYLTLPREVLAQKMDSITIHPYRKNQEEALRPSDETIKRTAEILRGATNPLIITGRLGSDPTAVSAMVSFAEALVGARGHAGKSVREYAQHARFSSRRELSALHQRCRRDRRRRKRCALVSGSGQAAGELPRSSRSPAIRTTAAYRFAIFPKIFPSAAIPSSRCNCWRKN